MLYALLAMTVQHFARKIKCEEKRMICQLFRCSRARGQQHGKAFPSETTERVCTGPVSVSVLCLVVVPPLRVVSLDPRLSCPLCSYSRMHAASLREPLLCYPQPTSSDGQVGVSLSGSGIEAAESPTGHPPEARFGEDAPGTSSSRIFYYFCQCVLRGDIIVGFVAFCRKYLAPRALVCHATHTKAVCR